MKIFDVCVVGSGPAGLMSAITAGSAGRSVILLEKNGKIGRKILATGNGRCNITNKNINISRYHGGDKNFITEVINKFDQNKTINYFESLGILLKEEDKGRIFPVTNQAQTIVDALTHELEKNNVKIELQTEVKNIVKEDDFIITLISGNVIFARKLILATGGKAAHQFGSSGDGIFWARNFGHTITQIHAALCPIEVNESWVRDIQGLRVEAKLTAMVDNKKIAEFYGDTLFTHFGISGPAPMAFSGDISPLINKSEIKIIIDLFSNIEVLELDNKLEKIFKNAGKKSVKNSLSGVIPQNLVPIILKIIEIDENKKAAEISAKYRKNIVNALKNLTITVKSIRPLKEAQVTRGGVELSEINSKTLESKIIKNLYFAGEIMDVDGDSGGFNLQWAWSSGYLAGNSI